ncbi:MAG: hypothetical protein ACE37J_11990 [Pikeienuella sp.]|uniref:hypothetical protein n=1 Tax=Pikeienuella sp. TaxID=2831957 RepID=UPI00391BFB56
MSAVLLIVMWLGTGEVSSIGGFQTIQACRAAVAQLMAAWAAETRRELHATNYDGPVFVVEGYVVGVCADTGLR